MNLKILKLNQYISKLDTLCAQSIIFKKNSFALLKNDRIKKRGEKIWFM